VLQTVKLRLSEQDGYDGSSGEVGLSGSWVIWEKSAYTQEGRWRNLDDGTSGTFVGPYLPDFYEFMAWNWTVGEGYIAWIEHEWVGDEIIEHLCTPRIF
jgi:hypothetical protein